MLVLRQEPERRPQADRGAHRLHLRRVHRPLQRHHRGGGRSRGELRHLHSATEAGRDQGGPRRVRDRAGAREEGPRGGGAQPLQED